MTFVKYSTINKKIQNWNGMALIQQHSVMIFRIMHDTILQTFNIIHYEGLHISKYIFKVHIDAQVLGTTCVKRSKFDDFINILGLATKLQQSEFV